MAPKVSKVVAMHHQTLPPGIDDHLFEPEPEEEDDEEEEVHEPVWASGPPEDQGHKRRTKALTPMISLSSRGGEGNTASFIHGVAKLVAEGTAADGAAIYLLDNAGTISGTDVVSCRRMSSHKMSAEATVVGVGPSLVLQGIQTQEDIVISKAPHRAEHYAPRIDRVVPSDLERLLVVPFGTEGGPQGVLVVNNQEATSEEEVRADLDWLHVVGTLLQNGIRGTIERQEALAAEARPSCPSMGLIRCLVLVPFA